MPHTDRPHIEIAYDIDPLTPLGPTPNPLPVELLRRDVPAEGKDEGSQDAGDEQA